jgi:glycosyltransferase involved in cell wall biosynthesis
LFSSPGGDTVQMLKTKEFLERDFEVSITIQPDLKAVDYRDFDLIHFFNIIRPNNILAHINQGLPYVVSPIFVDYTEYDQQVRGGVMGKISKMVGRDHSEYLKIIARWVKNKEYPASSYFLTHGFKNSVQKILDGCSVMLPNSENELSRLKRDYQFDCESVIVPNAVDTSIFNNDPEKPKKGIVSVARIEGLKNQLNLIRAVNQTNMELTVIGKPAPNHFEYYQICKNEAGSGIKFIDHIEPNDLVKYYQKAKIHAMVSWFETTGLSSLEAAACGCNVVISNKGDQRDYFHNDAFYADPASIESIKKALLLADKAEKPSKLIQRIKTQYSWEKTAEKTYQAYKKALN